MATRAATTKKASSRSASTKTTRKSATSAPATATKNTFVGQVQDSVRSVALWRSYGAEFIGTLLLASVIIAGQGQPIFVLFALAGIVLLVGAISGAHVNPAITIAAWVTRRIGWLRAVGYIVAQALGATAALLIFNAFIGAAPQPDPSTFSTGATLFKAADVTLLTGKEWFLFFSELVGTAILGFAIANATREVQDRVAAAFTAGLGIFIALMLSISFASYAGGSAIINPAVAISLQAYSAALLPFVIYLVAPILGAIIGFVLYDLHRGRVAR